MTSEELLQQLKFIQNIKCETQTLELKSEEKGCPTRLYDSLFSFSNQDSGGVIVFGVDEAQGYREVGVYDAQDSIRIFLTRFSACEKSVYNVSKDEKFVKDLLFIENWSTIKP